MEGGGNIIIFYLNYIEKESLVHKPIIFINCQLMLYLVIKYC